MLRKWEANDPEIRALWEKMNEWVYAGFDETYKRMGVSFDKIYYESNTYLEGKSEVEKGLAAGEFYRREDGSVWANLEKDGLDEKLLLRSDGTSVYMTQDIGTAKLRYQDYPINKMVYVVGNEQEYHFKVLSILLDRLGFPFGKELVHFSYGMVELPEGKMKSREGTVVDADDLMDEMIATAKETSAELGKLDDCTAEEADRSVLDMYFRNLNIDYKLLTTGEETVNAKNFKRFPKEFRPLTFDYGYCITCHKSQGSEYSKVLVFEEFLKGNDHARWLYTAATRAKEKLVIVRNFR
jgi:hypothetical protein